MLNSLEKLVADLNLVLQKLWIMKVCSSVLLLCSTVFKQMKNSRASRLMDQLEIAGIIGPADGAKPRKVLPLILDVQDYRKKVEKEEHPRLNQWEINLCWCPSQIYYYFRDAVKDNWCIYLRWSYSDPWTAELVRCDEKWEFLWDSPDTVDLFEEKEHIPGTVTGFYRDDEYRELMDKVLDLVKNLSPKFKEI